MPHLDGMGLLKAFRAKDKATPVTMVTAEAEKQRIITALQAGVNNYVVNPFTPDLLSERFNQTLGKAGLNAA